MTLQQEILFRMQGVDQIHFNLQGMSSFSETMRAGALLQPGDQGFQYTSWELSKIWHDAALLGKTPFTWINDDATAGP